MTLELEAKQKEKHAFKWMHSSEREREIKRILSFICLVYNVLCNAASDID